MRIVAVVAAVAGALALAACGGDSRPTTEELLREIQERPLSEFNSGSRAVCESRSLSRIIGSVGDEACECVLQVAREQITDDELVASIIDDVPLPEAVERRTIDVCRGPDGG